LEDVPLLCVVRLASRERVLLTRPALKTWDASAGERVLLLRLLRGCGDFGPQGHKRAFYQTLRLGPDLEEWFVPPPRAEATKKNAACRAPGTN
jgi:hypothetical protein